MSTVTLIVAIISLVGILLCYAFVQQTIQANREQRKRLTAALRARVRSFKFMLSGFPTGFLPKELTALVQRSLADVCEQLSRLEPGNQEHAQDLQMVTAMINETQRQPPQQSAAPLENQQQIKDVKNGLEELHKFVFRLEQRRVLASNQSQIYRNQIRDMMVQVTVDAYCLSGNQANQAGKIKLAIHYFDLALSLILREGKADIFRAKVQKLQQTIEQLKEVSSQEVVSPESNPDNIPDLKVQSEWDKFGSKDSVWKKKNVYD